MDVYQWLARFLPPVGTVLSNNTLLAAVVVTLVTTVSVRWLQVLHRGKTSPPSLWDPVPCVYNTAQFVFNNTRFTVRVRNLLKHSRIGKFYLFKTPVFLISGERNIRTVFAASHKIGNESLFVQNVFPSLYRMPKQDVQKFADDKSGRSAQRPAPGTEDIPTERRYWVGYEHVHSDYLSRTQHVLPIARYYCQALSRTLDELAPKKGNQTTLSVVEFCKRHVTGTAISAMFGPRILEINPGLVDAFWGFDSNIFLLTLCFPRWIAPGAHRAQDRFFGMVSKYLEAGLKETGTSGDPSSLSQDWEPNFGGRVVREVAGWFLRNGFQKDIRASALGMLMMGLNSNTIPTTMWTIIEVLTDPSLFQEIRQEVAEAYTTDPKTGNPVLDLEKLVTLPLLQSVVAEVLRVRVSFNLMRNVNEPIIIEGGFTLPKGAMVQVPTDIAHYDETIWGGNNGHPPTEFWAERHIRYKEEVEEDGQEPGELTKKRVFSLAGRPSSYFPFGGGLEICPGRYYAKYQIFATIALVVSKFHVEVLGWTSPDGSPSGRPAKAHPRYSGTGVVHPDRDLKVLLTRIG